MPDPKPAAPPAMVRMRDPWGQLQEVDARDVGKAREEGWKSATAGEWAAAEHQAKYSTPLEMAKAAGEGALAGATFGVSRHVGNAIGGDAYRAAQTARQEVNPLVAGGGELVGSIAPLLLTGGASEAVSGAEGLAGGADLARSGMTALDLAKGAAALSPSGLTARAGAAAEHGVAAILGSGAESGLGRAIQYVAPKAAASALEGVAYGAGQGLSEAALGDPNVAGESILAHVGHAALMGGALGLGAGIGLGAAGFGARSLFGAAEKSEGAVARSAAKAFADTAGTVTGQDARLLERGLTDPEFRSVLATDVDKVVAKEAHEAAGALSTMRDKSEVARQLAFGENKRLQVTNLMDNESALPEARKLISNGQDGLVDQLELKLTEWKASPEVYRDRGRVKEFGDYLTTFKKQIAAAADSETEKADLFLAANEMKQKIGTLSKADKYLGVKDMVAKDARELYEGLRAPLEREDLWDRAASLQREHNSITHRKISTDQPFDDQFMIKDPEGNPHPVSPWMHHEIVDEGRVASVFNGINDPANVNKIKSMSTTIDMHIAEAESVIKHMGLEGKDLAAMQAQLAAAKSARSTMDRAVRNIDAVKRFQEMADKGGGLIGGNLPLLGGVLGGAPGAVVGGALSLLANPAKQIIKLAKIEKLVGGKMSGGLSTLIESTAGHAAYAAKHAVAPIVVDVAAARSTVEKTRKQLAQIKRNPQAYTDALGAQMSTVAQTAPRVADAAIQAHVRATDFLAAKLPAASAPRDVLTPRVGSQEVPAADALKFARYERAVEDPHTVIVDMATGHLSREGVESVQAVYPALYSQMQSAAMAQLTKVDKPLPYEMKLSLGMLLNIPADPTLAPASVAAFQGVYTQKQAQKMQREASSKAPDIAKEYSLEGEGKLDQA